MRSMYQDVSGSECTVHIRNEMIEKSTNTATKQEQGKKQASKRAQRCSGLAGTREMEQMDTLPLLVSDVDVLIKYGERRKSYRHQQQQ